MKRPASMGLSGLCERSLQVSGGNGRVALNNANYE
jgi:hypothetical protein